MDFLPLVDASGATISWAAPTLAIALSKCRMQYYFLLITNKLSPDVILNSFIAFWGALELNFLYPNALVADACYKLVEKYKKGERIDYRLSDTDLVHLGYALAYKVDYFLTTDTKLRYNVPEKSNLRVIDHEMAKEIF